MCINLRYHVENVWINEFPSNKVSGMTHTQYTLHRIDASKMFQWKLMKEEKAINLYNMQIAFVCSFDSWFFLGMNKLFSYVIPLRILNNVAVQWQFNWRIWRDILHFDTYSLVAIAVLGKWLAVWLFLLASIMDSKQMLWNLPIHSIGMTTPKTKCYRSFFLFCFSNEYSECIGYEVHIYLLPIGLKSGKRSFAFDSIIHSYIQSFIYTQIDRVREPFLWN